MQTINPEISIEKFDKEVNQFLSSEEMHRKRGIIMLKREFPNVILSFSAIQLKPAVHVFAVKVNFDNYDLDPPSIRFIDPFTWEDLPNIPIPMLRRMIKDNGMMELQPLVQQDTTGLPFICFPGVREYHRHPAHSGNSWLLHRKVDGEGTLGFLVEKIFEYGISAISSFQFQTITQVVSPIAQIGFDPNLIPT